MAPSLRAIFNVWRKKLVSPGNSSDDPFRSGILALKSPFVMRAVVDALNIQPDDNVLEIGLGAGDGVLSAYEKLKDGSGTLYTVDKWKYLYQSVKGRFNPKALEEHRIVFREVPDLKLLPYNNEFFDKIFHVHSQYFWMSDLHEVLSELVRVLKPGGLLLCGMQLKKLQVLEKLRMVQRKHYDPSRYLLSLEPAGLVDIKMQYLKTEMNTDYQLIQATKPSFALDERDPKELSEYLEKSFMDEFNVDRSITEGLSLLDVKRELSFRNLLENDESVSSKVYLENDADKVARESAKGQLVDGSEKSARKEETR